MGKYFLFSILTAASLLLMACSGKEKEITVQSIAISQPSAELEIGETLTLKATVSPSNAFYDGITWTSTNPKVATVSGSGVVTAISEGTTTITVMAGGKTANCSVTVRPVVISSVTLDKEALSLIIGESYSLFATVLPENAANRKVLWSSSDYSVAEVDETGKVTAVGVGVAKITVTTEDGGMTATCFVVVSAISVTGISLDKTELSLIIGDKEQLTATVVPSNATDKSVTWSSSDISVASVTAFGEITAEAPGAAIITVTTNDGDKKATCSVTVKPIPVSVTGVSLDQASLSMFVGQTQSLTATVTPSNATNKSVTWSSSNLSVATVSSSGVVTAITEGIATIVVTTEDGGKTANCNVTVSESKVPVPEAVDLGLPSGLKWASFNLGASKPQEFGYYYAWGETEPKDDYSWPTYKWGKDGSLTKYCYNGRDGYDGFKDNKVFLEVMDDAASVALGGKWRMPTSEEQQELMNMCSWKWTTMDGVEGRKVTGPNGNSIFFPAAKSRRGTGFYNYPRPNGFYWSSSIDMENTSFWAMCMVILDVSVKRDGFPREDGFSVRPVSE